MNDDVKRYIEKQEEPKKTILKELRGLILQILPGCQEEFKWGVPVYDGGKIYIAAMRTRVHIGFTVEGLAKEEVKNLEGSGKTMRHIKLYSLDDIDAKNVSTMIKTVHEKSNVAS